MALGELAAAASAAEGAAAGDHSRALVVTSQPATAGRAQGQQLPPPSKRCWPVWHLHLNVDVVGKFETIRTTLLGASGSTAATPVALVYINNKQRKTPAQLVDSIVVIYSGDGRRSNVMERTFTNLWQKLFPSRTSGGRLPTKPNPLSFQGLSDLLASLPADAWSCTSTLPHVGEDKESLKNYIQRVSATP